ncbi:precorrin-3B synthase [Pseudomonas sp. TNT2022 ID1025]|uniref:Precorrin-3B synthase n=1 Tax=Pseudomonas rubra TaxID=2942627 RepID=A0ABT5P473_9PSED|nr:precorrin-3B synthase [Pseudomonas rubra]MDD1038185.1 precorrin-3B synthase [Pseudomonas rubra]MDD1156735.1 precorrin-3B synthase [Pseudomonas rubra]
MWRIVQALDGGICRIKLAGSALTADQADAVATAAERYAGGDIEVTNRGNLQIRGIGCDHSALIEMLLAADLGPREAAGDDVRNLMLSPTAGIDPQMLFDTRPLARQLLQALETTPRFHQLSAKFAVQLDGGEALAMLDHPHDLWLSPLKLDGELWLAFGLAGCPAKDAPLGAVPLTRGHELVLAVLKGFLDLARPEQARMRQLLTEHAPEAFIAGLAVPVRVDAVVGQWRRAQASASYLGIYPQLQHGLSAVGGAAPLGRLNPSMLRGAARLAREQGDGTLRMTPWQGVLLPNIAQRQAEGVSASLARLGLLVCAKEPLSRLVACTGSAGCAKGQADTKGDARLLATLLAPGAPASVHLSGCPRSCAMAHIAPATLLAQSPGRYDLFLRDATQPGFGDLRARNLTLKEAGALLDACSRSTLDD